ncbi:MAG: [FeFe] hydrogenase H-cluster maturation GTPase HydF [Clostridia bacterium]|nr:[FeFe] hydrogenase H-cluster maturation GTPase HydF [Clostridia bacterium]
MGLNETASADRLHIGFFGKRNAGKSSLCNAVTGQELSVVSDVRGTTTDPVRKAMELLPLGPVVIIDTPGLDDEGELGALRVKRTRQVLNYVDLAVLTVDATVGMTEPERELCEIFKNKNIPYVIAYNKSDLLATVPQASENEIYVSARDGVNINELKDKMAALVKASDEQKFIVGDLIEPNDKIVLVVPIDKAAPKGRLILPQQQTIRDILDSGATALVCRDTELSELLASLPQKPRMVITDSQAFGKVSKIVPRDVELTSFSILFARYKGNLREAVRGAAMLDKLQDGDKILISEGCTHHRQCGDIGTVKLPKWIGDYTGKKLDFEFTSGRDFPDDLSNYALVIHCGGCMLTEREMQYRARHASDSGIPMSNYGIIIAHTHGILRRSLEPFKDILNELN